MRMLSWFLLAAACPGALDAQELRQPPRSQRDHSEPFRHTHSWQLDQDLIAPNNEDRDYTQGLSFEWFTEERDPNAYPNDLWGFSHAHELLDGAASTLSLRQADGQAKLVTSMGLGSIAFTPDNIAAAAPVTNERPYSNLFYYTQRRIQESPDGSVGTELRLGMLGTNVASYAQTKIHQANRVAFNSDQPVDPNGWGNQISDGGELTFLYRVSSDRIVSRGEWHDLALTSDVNLGYQVNGSLGFTYRLGRMENGTHSTPFDPMSRANFVPALAPGDQYFFCAARVRGVAYDALLQGQLKHNAYDLRTRDVSRVVVQAALGLSTSFSRSHQLTYSVTARTHEFADQRRTHWWGGLTYSRRY